MLVPVLVSFGRALRDEGLAVGSGDVLAYCSALAVLDPTDLVDLYWAGRVTLVCRQADIPVYDAVFRRFFLGADSPASFVPRPSQVEGSTEAWFDVPAAEPGMERPEEALLGLRASGVETLRRKSFSACTPAELAALRRLMARLLLSPPMRRSRRTVIGPAGRAPALRPTLRRSLRTGGDPFHLYWRRRRPRPRPLILILDVSGSMADHSRAFLQFAFAARRSLRRVEVFCFGTRLTRVTPQLRVRRPDDALRRAAAHVVDWEGGTRIGACLAQFVKSWARRGLCRGGIVLICSDGLDRGDPAVLAGAMERLARLSHRVRWLTPHTSGSLPVGLTAAEPFVDAVVAGRSPDDFARILDS